MAQKNSFDVTSEIDLAEVSNAVNQATLELNQRFDLKGTNSGIEFDPKEALLTLVSADEFNLKAVIGILQQKLIKRGVSIRALTYAAIEAAAKGSVRQKITLQQGITTEKAKEIVKHIKDRKLKVQAAINGDLVRVTGKDRDTLQSVIAVLKEHDFGIDLQFGNYRGN